MMRCDFNQLILPKNLFTIVEEEGFWETDDFNPFFIEVSLVEGDTEKGNFLFSIQFNPNGSEFNRWNQYILHRGFEENGYGWEQFLAKEIEKSKPSIIAYIEFDSEAETCFIATVSQDIFYTLLKCLHEIFNTINISQN